MQYILTIDQGTSSTKSIIFDAGGEAIFKASEPLKTYYLEGGLVEQKPQAIYENVLLSVKKCLDGFKFTGGDTRLINVCGITNQRETFILWDKNGEPLYNAVVWQCKRSTGECERLEKEGLGTKIKEKTGLIIDPYFSGSKVIRLNENEPKVRGAIARGDAYFGNVDTWLLYKLTHGKCYMTDYTNASRTMFFNLKTLDWDKELLADFGLSKLNLPELKPSSYQFGETDLEGLLDHKVRISALIGDSHAAAVGEGCFSPGTAKATLGTGCSILMNVGSSVKNSEHGMVSTICWSMEGRVDYAVEGVIVSCGSIIEWLKNQLGFFSDSKATEKMAKAVTDNGGVYLIPAFSGLGAPYWQMNRKASINGLTFSSNKNHVVRAALESVAFQIKDIVTVMEKDTGVLMKKLMINGGMISNNFLLQLIADLLGSIIGKQGVPDISAQGAAFLTGLQSGLFKDTDHLISLIQSKSEIHPEKNNDKISKAFDRWKSLLMS